MNSEQRRENEERTFADVLGGFTFGGARSARSEPEPSRHCDEEPRPPASEPELEPLESDDLDEVASVVRAYSWTAGRTHSDVSLQIETLVSTSELGESAPEPMQAEHRFIAQLCRQSRSVAEVAALLSIPLGVAKVLLGDMATAGLILVHSNNSWVAGAPEMRLMERILSGLQKL
jgi:Protein of unknown function (DUF742)